MLWGLVLSVQVPHVLRTHCGVCSSPFPELVASLPFVVRLAWSLVPDHVSTPTFGLPCFFLSTVKWKVCSASLRVLFWVGCTDVAVVGQDKLRILLFGLVPEIHNFTHFKLCMLDLCVLGFTC